MTKTSYTIDPTDKSRQFLQMAGVPALLLNPFKFDLERLIQPWQFSQDKVISKKQQIEWFSNMQTKFDEYTAVISSQEHYLLARQIATVVFWQHIANSLNHSATQILPYWHSPSSDFKNSLLDEYNSGRYRLPNMLVIDNIHADMSSIRLDKVNDILQNIGNRPRLLIFRGNNARQFCIDKLGVRPNYIIQIGASETRKTIKI